MDKNFLIQLTNNVYRLTLLFPKKEPLRYKMRELADEILAYLIKLSPEEYPPSTNKKLIEDGSLSALEVLDSFFGVAREQNWVDSGQLLEIQEEYSKIKGELKKREVYFQLNRMATPSFEEKKEEELLLNKPSKTEGFQEGFQEKNLDPNPPTIRQEKIMGFLKENGRVQVWEIKKIFPEITKRTLRRDFRQLLKQDLVERIGERNETFYQLKN